VFFRTATCNVPLLHVTQVVRGPYLLSASPTSMTIRWRTNTMCRGRLAYTATRLHTVVSSAGMQQTSAQWTEAVSARCPGMDQEVVLRDLVPATV
jgi:hypothetical protein